MALTTHPLTLNPSMAGESNEGWATLGRVKRATEGWILLAVGGWDYQQVLGKGVRPMEGGEFREG